MPPPRNFNTCFLLWICYNHARTTSMMSWQSHRGYFVTDSRRKRRRERPRSSHQVKYCGARVFCSVCARLYWILQRRPRRHNTVCPAEHLRAPPADIIVLHEVSGVAASSENNLSSVPLGGGSVGGAAPTDGNRKYIMPRKGIPKELCSHLLSL